MEAWHLCFCTAVLLTLATARRASFYPPIYLDVGSGLGIVPALVDRARSLSMDCAGPPAARCSCGCCFSCRAATPLCCRPDCQSVSRRDRLLAKRLCGVARRRRSPCYFCLCSCARWREAIRSTVLRSDRGRGVVDQPPGRGDATLHWPLFLVVASFTRHSAAPLVIGTISFSLPDSCVGRASRCSSVRTEVGGKSRKCCRWESARKAQFHLPLRRP